MMEAMMEEHPKYRRGRGAKVLLLEPATTRGFERAMAELQQGLWIVKSEERYEPTFSYRWDLVESWLPEAVAAGRKMSREAALVCVIERYTRGAVFTTERLLVRLFGVPSDEAARAVARLVATGAVDADHAIDGWPGPWP